MHSQWIHMIIQNQIGSGQLTIRHIKMEWGYFHKPFDKHAEISTEDAESQVATPNENVSIASCGRPDSASGTEGSYDIYDEATKVCHIYWNCVEISKANTFTVSDIDSNYHVEATGATLDAKALGDVTIKVAKTG